MTASIGADGRSDDRQRLRLTVTGTVQGVGFRPHVHRLATELDLVGEVSNDTTSVTIEVEGPGPDLERFQRRLRGEAPPLARIATIDVAPLAPVGSERFTITPSRHAEGAVTNAPPDTVPCVECLRELHDPRDRRYRYPFITCTNCGPRFTIITSLPYDRPATTMAGFPLCNPCRTEYEDPADRRFHAQPVACHDCGPRITLHDPSVPAASDPVTSGTSRQHASDAVLARTQALLADGAIVAVKGIGGYHLACRADDEEVVARLRARKQRPGKPFALMVRDLDVATRLAHIDEAEASVLSDPAAPIVLVRRRGDAPLAAGVAPGNPLVGLMLPASPLHHLILSAVPGSHHDAPDVLVLTSGNLSEEPLCTDDLEARERLAGIADAFLAHDRSIAVPCDDSVVRVDGVDGQPTLTMIRRSRGYVPAPIPLPYDGVPALAVGGQLKTTAGLTDGHQAWLSAHIGDMGTLPTLRAFERTVTRFAAMHDVTPTRLVADAHPDYTTRRWAEDQREEPVTLVQHHHAHIAAVMAEHGLSGDETVTGIAFDGTGYGPDETIWGGEILVADYDGSERVAHLSTVLLPGGDAAIRHPARVALSHLRTAGIAWNDDLPPVAAIPAPERTLLATQLERQLRTVPTSSMGRLFDAVASLIGLRHEITFEAQAAIELEIAATRTTDAPATLSLPVREQVGDRPMVLDATSLFHDVVAALRRGSPVAGIALGFHVAVADAVRDIAVLVRQRGGPRIVALSGGVFTNALLTRLATSRLQAEGFTMLRHERVPPNDGGLALGQLAIGARRQRPSDEVPRAPASVRGHAPDVTTRSVASSHGDHDDRK